MKTCTKCEVSKNEAEFHRHKGSPDGLKPRCKVCRNAQNKKHREANSEYFQKWRDDNKADVKKYNNKYHSENKDRMNKERAARANKNKEATVAYKQKWYLENKDKVMASKRRRRDRKANCNENYTRGDERITLQAFGNKCFNCDRTDKLHIDHHRPLIKGFGLSIGNAVVLCETCNLSKSTKSPEEFYGKEICIILNKKLALLKEQVKE